MSRRPRRAGDGFRNVPAFVVDARRRRRCRRRREPSATTWPTAATSTRWSRRPRSGLEPVPVAGAQELIARGLRDHRRDQRVGAAGAPGRPGDPRLQARRLPRARPRRRRRAQRDRDPPRLARPLAVRDRNLGADGRSSTRAGELALGEEFVNESVIGSRFIGTPGRGGELAIGARGRARDQRPGMDHRDGPVPARSDRPVPGGLRALRRARERLRGRVIVVGGGAVGLCVAEALATRGGAR